MPGDNNETLHMQELKDGPSKKSDDNREINKKCTLDPKLTLDKSYKYAEEKNDEDETNSEEECESWTEIDSLIEIREKKAGRKNNTTEGNIGDKLDSNNKHNSSNAKSTPKESHKINEISISKETVTITGAGSYKEGGIRRKDASTNTSRNSDSRLEQKLNHGETGDGNKDNGDHDDQKRINKEQESLTSSKQFEKKSVKEDSVVVNTPKRVLSNSGVRPKSGLPPNPPKKDKKTLKKIGLFALKTAVISGVILAGTALVVPALGFGALGVTGGSLAAAYQSTVLGGTIASGSAFATLQSIGMAGLSAAAQTTVVAGSAVASGAHTMYKSSKKNNI